MRNSFEIAVNVGIRVTEIIAQETTPEFDKNPTLVLAGVVMGMLSFMETAPTGVPPPNEFVELQEAALRYMRAVKYVYANSNFDSKRI